MPDSDLSGLTAGVHAALLEAGEPHVEAPLRLTPIAGGASRETWLVEVGEDSEWRYVLRRDPEGGESAAPQSAEFELMGRARAVGVPAPEPLHHEPAGGRFGTAGVLMRYVAGQSVAPRVLRRPELEQARAMLPGQLAEALARVHSLGPAEVGDVLPAPGGDPVLAELDRWRQGLDAIGEPLPGLELGLRWLRSERPPPAAPRLVHGDFRLGNFIVSEQGLAAVIDWELAHLGDPAEDIGWLCIRSWRFGNDERRLAGLGELEAFLAAYERAGGEAIDPERVRFWEVFGNLKWAAICARQAQDHLTGLRPSHELASLGRRVCEPEWDMLALISAVGA